MRSSSGRRFGRRATASENSSLAFSAGMTKEDGTEFERNPDGWFGVVGLVGTRSSGTNGLGARILLDGEATLCTRRRRRHGSFVPGHRRRRGIYRSMTGAFYETLGARGSSRSATASRTAGARDQPPPVDPATLFPCGRFRSLRGADLNTRGCRGRRLGQRGVRHALDGRIALSHPCPRCAIARARLAVHARPTRWYRWSGGGRGGGNGLGGSFVKARPRSSRTSLEAGRMARSPRLLGRRPRKRNGSALRGSSSGRRRVARPRSGCAALPASGARLVIRSSSALSTIRRRIGLAPVRTWCPRSTTSSSVGGGRPSVKAFKILETYEDRTVKEQDLIPYESSDLTAERILVLAAHPDDEVLGAGGVLALAAERGSTVRVWIATDGTAQEGVAEGEAAAYGELRRDERAGPPGARSFPLRVVGMTDRPRGELEAARPFVSRRDRGLRARPRPLPVSRRDPSGHRALAEALYGMVPQSRAGDPNPTGTGFCCSRSTRSRNPSSRTRSSTSARAPGERTMPSRSTPHSNPCATTRARFRA